MKMRMMNIISLFCLVTLLYSFKTQRSDDDKCCPIDHTMTITGSASVSIPSDLIKIGVIMETKETLAGDSLKKNTQISRSVDKALKDLGLKSTDISTTSFSISASYKSVLEEDKKTYKSVFDGYKVINNIDIRLKELVFAGKVVDRVIDAGATSITGITFTNDENVTTKAKKELLAQASADAIEKANLILTPLKMKIKDISSVSNSDYSSGGYFARPSMNIMNNNNNSVPAVYGNDNSISASVTVTFIIEKI
jgi:uncharacterized protein YggE